MNETARVYDASDASQVKKAEKQRKVKGEVELEDYKKILSTEEGRRFVHRILVACKFYTLSYCPGDTHNTAFNEGQRAIGSDVLVKCQRADMLLYQRMLIENDGEIKNGRRK